MTWLTASKLTVNINKSNFVIFRPYEKRLAYQVAFGSLESNVYIKYLCFLIDKSLSQKYHIDSIATKISTSVVANCKATPLCTSTNTTEYLQVTSRCTFCSLDIAKEMLLFPSPLAGINLLGFHLCIPLCSQYVVQVPLNTDLITL